MLQKAYEILNIGFFKTNLPISKYLLNSIYNMELNYYGADREELIITCYSKHQKYESDINLKIESRSYLVRYIFYFTFQHRRRYFNDKFQGQNCNHKLWGGSDIDERPGWQAM